MLKRLKGGWRGCICNLQPLTGALELLWDGNFHDHGHDGGYSDTMQFMLGNVDQLCLPNI
jgi:hypothetical protein